MSPEAGTEDPSGGEAVVRVEALRKTYNGLTALDGLSLEVRRAELFGLVGPDGAGKTTLIKILVGLVFPDSGRAVVKGIDVARRPAERRAAAGYMPQNFSLYPDLTVEENLVFYADLYGIAGSERERRLDRLYRFSRLEPFRKRPAGKLSGGMKQKLALSSTLIGGPDLLLLDEPTTGVDPVSRRELWDILGELVREGITVIVSTPYMDEAGRCDRVALIHEGKTLAVDEPDRLSALFQQALIEVKGPDPAALSRALRGIEGVLWVQPLGDRLHAALAGVSADAVRERLTIRGAGFDSVREIGPGMEDIFLSLMGGG